MLTSTRRSRSPRFRCRRSYLPDRPSASLPMPPIAQAPVHAALQLRGRLRPTGYLRRSAALRVWSDGWCAQGGPCEPCARHDAAGLARADAEVLASPFLLEPGLVGLLRPVLVVPEHPSGSPGRPARASTRSWRTRPAICDVATTSTAAAQRQAGGGPVSGSTRWCGGSATRLIERGKRAGDEAVVGAGHDRSAYARSLLESARLYPSESPCPALALPARSGNLKSRVEAIMTAPA